MTDAPSPRLLVLDDREGLIRAAPGADPGELLDAEVAPSDGALGGVRKSSA